MTSILPDLNISKTPIYESLVAVRGDPYQVDRPARGWSLPAAGTDFGAANDILGRLLAQGGSDGQGWVAMILVGGPAAAQLSQQLAQGTMAGLPGPFAGGYNPLAAYQVLQAIQTMQAMQALQNQGQPWPQPELPYAVAAPLAFEAGPSGYDYRSYGDTDPITASMASNMAAGIVQNALQASSPSGFMYDQYANQPSSRPDPYAASALTPAPAYPGALQANPLDSERINAANATALQEIHAPRSDYYGPGPGVPMPTMVFPPGTLPMTPDAYPGYPGATYPAMGQSAGGREQDEDSADGRRGRCASALRELRRR